MYSYLFHLLKLFFPTGLLCSMKKLNCFVLRHLTAISFDADKGGRGILQHHYSLISVSHHQSNRGHWWSDFNLPPPTLCPFGHSITTEEMAKFHPLPPFLVLFPSIDDTTTTLWPFFCSSSRVHRVPLLVYLVVPSAKINSLRHPPIGGSSQSVRYATNFQLKSFQLPPTTRTGHSLEAVALKWRIRM